jgi:ribosomal protein S18 acetylase RimI-like enzyme
MSDLAKSIREYQPGDRQQVEYCLAELQDFSKLIYENVADGTIAPRYLQHLLKHCGETNGRIFVAESDGRIVGMICIYATVKSREADEEEYDYAYISDLVILPGQRGQGWGRALLKRAEDHAKSQGAPVLKINALAQNQVARNLYLSYGFAELLVVLHKKL